MKELIGIIESLFGPHAALPAMMTVVLVQLYFIRKHMASKKDVQIAIFEHTRECQNKIVEAITPVSGKSNGRARVVMEGD